MENKRYEVSAFYFPNYHKGDRHNEVWHGEGWTEWELIKCARPRFEGHEIPMPLWGFEDEAEIPVMEKKIKTAVDHGITNFIFDWYWYEDGPFLNKPLDEAFLKAKNCEDIKFCIMWANHDWANIHPIGRIGLYTPACLLEGKISPKTFFEAIDYMIANYFSRPNYFRLEGGLFLSIYEINKFVETFGGIEGAAEAIKEIRRRVKAAGLGEIHLNAVVWGVKILANESERTIDGSALKSMGFDSVMSYVWIHEHVIESYPTQDYADFRKLCEKDFEILTKRFEGIPYYPNVTCGWDASPRTIQSEIYGDLGYPFSRVLVNNTPEEFEKALINVKRMLDESNLKTKMFTINAWNEWTEGSYLEPDTKYGYGRLEAIKKVFGKA